MKAITALMRLLFGLALAACAVLPAAASATSIDAGKASLSAQSVDLGNQSLGTIGAPRQLWLTNTGSDYLFVEGVRIGEGDEGDFTIEADSCSSTSLAVEDVCGFELRFSPAALGTRAATLFVESNDPDGPLEVPISGTGMPPTHQLTVGIEGTGSGQVSFEPDGFSCAETCVNDFYEGSAIMLTATPDPGSTFAGWSGGDCTGGTEGCGLTIGAETTVTAEFVATPVTGGPDPGTPTTSTSAPPLAGPSLAPPRSTRKPKIAGKPKPGSKLTCTTGSWSGDALTFKRLWLRDGRPIRTATTAKYTVRRADAGHAIACRVTAANAAGAAAVTSAALRVRRR